MSRSLTVQSSKHPYTVRFEDSFGVVLKEQIAPGDVVVVDDKVLKLYQQQLSPVLKDRHHIVIEPSEKAEKLSRG